MDKWVVVSGASGDIGSAVCETAQAEGYKVVAIDLADPKVGPEEWLTIDLAEAGQPEVSQIQEFVTGRHVEYAIGVVGGAILGELVVNQIEDLSMEILRRSWDLNVSSAFALLLGTLPAIRKADAAGRSVTFVSSINAFGGYGAVPYSSAKAGLGGLVASSAPDLASVNIRINALALGTTLTKKLEDISAAAGRSADFESLGSRLPRGRVLSSEESAMDIWALATQFTAVTGQVLVSDGAQSLARIRSTDESG